MSSQKNRKAKQKSLLSWVKPQNTKAIVEDKNVEESSTCAAGIPEGSSESGQDYAVVESIEALGSLLPLLGDRPNQPRNLSFPSKSYGNRNRSFQSGWFIAIRGCTTLKVYAVHTGTSSEGGSRRRP
ncbi:hypothetical protein OS493_002996 [Desmophyllum pertusum]|uniref:Uncharacterized protein n=1 Tax=Desmophyllum pertusum TaxID=174260 RepID=A0A9W9YGC8_9CNID|nr:hypothetical protein OS493_002996 [Desmophyllum pertusum]